MLKSEYKTVMGIKINSCYKIEIAKFGSDGATFIHE